MEQQSTSGGSKSTDFQPITGNPQSDVNGSLQPNSANLQPITTSNGSNVLNQPGVNSQAFPKTDSLQVLSTGSPSSTSNAQLNKNNSAGSGFLTVFIIAVLVLVSVILALAKMAKPAQDTKNIQPEEPKPKIDQNKPKKKTKSKKNKSKKTSKKR